MLTATGVALIVVAGWLGQRRVARGQTGRALTITNGLVLFNVGTAAMLLLNDALFPDNPWQWLLVFVTGTGLLGYALGTLLGLRRRL